MFNKKTWVNRQSEYPARRTLTPVSGETNVYDVTRSEGAVTVDGDAFSASNMNDLESRIEDAWDLTTGTLTAGATSITIADSDISSNSILCFYTDIYGVSPTEVTVSEGSVTLTFDAQASNMTVGVRVEGSY